MTLPSMVTLCLVVVTRSIAGTPVESLEPPAESRPKRWGAASGRCCEGVGEVAGGRCPQAALTATRQATTTKMTKRRSIGIWFPAEWVGPLAPHRATAFARRPLMHRKSPTLDSQYPTLLSPRGLLTARGVAAELGR